MEILCSYLRSLQLRNCHLQVLDWSLKYRFFDLKKIIVFVLDEADVMIATQGHQVGAPFEAGS